MTMESFLHCAVCFVSFDTQKHSPKSLPCGHTLCSQCLAKILQSPDLRKCPFDEHAFADSLNSVDSFPPTFALLEFLERHHEDKCEIHPDEKLKVICLTDRSKLCYECVDSGEHNGHRMKRIKKLKTQASKVKKELDSTLLQIRKYEENKDNDCETIRKQLITAIDGQCKEIKDIIGDKQFELVSHINTILDTAEKNETERIGAFKQEIDETMTNITQACNGERGDLFLLEKAVSSNQNALPQFLKEKSLEVHNKFINMQKAFERSLEKSKKAIKAFQLPSEEVVKEIYSVQEGREQLSEEALTEIDQRLRTLKFMSYFDVRKTDEEGCLEIYTRDGEPMVTELNPGDLKTAEMIDIRLARYDYLMQESSPSILLWIFRGGFLERLSSLEISFDSSDFNKDAVGCLANLISSSIPNLKSLSLDFEGCSISGEPFKSLCDLVFSKMNKVRDFYLYLNSSEITHVDLENLGSALKPFEKNFKCFALGLANNNLGYYEIFKVFSMMQNMEGLKNLQLVLSDTEITDRTVEQFAEIVLPYLKTLESFTFSVKKCEISDKGMSSLFKNLRNLKALELYLSETQVSDKTVTALAREMKRKLKSVKALTFVAKDTKVTKKSFWQIRDVSHKTTRHEDEDEDY